MTEDLSALIAAYDPSADLSQAVTPPKRWYTDSAIASLEADAVFARTWQLVARADEFQTTGDYVTGAIAGEPIVVVKDGSTLRAFFNVCRHHAAQVATDPCGNVRALHCPYHGWTYNLDGSLRSASQFEGVDLSGPEFGLQPVRVEVWHGWVFVCLDPQAPGLAEAHADVALEFDPELLNHHRRVTYELDCNWKVYVDNYLDGGYHVPFLHRELTGALDTSGYRIEVGRQHCMQSCPTSSDDNAAASVRAGQAWYLWLYPNLMINWYEGVMDVNLVLPSGPDGCIVHFDYYFADQDNAFREQSIAVADRVQQEDVAICEAVQRGLGSRSYETGRLSPHKEGGEQLFHQLLHRDLDQALGRKR